ncbi:amino acid adenylation domain-containing protein [Hydrocarboniphaga daqingensis]|uniref:Amino acid adenylation domain-containing protein n=1 Tax=Hydrocarboniphaga daqingensis TaxID=490188 RepID=A0A1M5PBA8_9GAMM|nr:non-ribosomal peptide synthetase [Hydrocarboniphaga daqingensis]SHG98739.1 amino acid adenylation domain-containing protein [Hydrocarboniphaga daqingensis]
MLSSRLTSNHGRNTAAAFPTDPSRATEPQTACTVEQQRLWLLDRIEPGNAALNLSALWRVVGGLPNAHLQRAFELIIERHAPLRCRFVEDDGMPVAVLMPPSTFHVPELDLSGLNDDDAETELQRIAQIDARTSFDLSVAPLIRVTQLRMPQSASIVMLTVHQLVCDRRSLGLLATELHSVCLSLSQRQAPCLPLLHRSYLDASVEGLTSDDEGLLGRDEAYWLRKLEGFTRCELRSDHPRAAVQSTRHGLRRLMLDLDQAQTLRACSQTWNCGLYASALSSLLVLLHRHTGDTDITIATEYAGRPVAELSDLIGAFARPLLLRVDLDGDPDFFCLLQRVSEQLGDGLRHASTRIDRLTERLQPQRDPSRNTLYSIRFHLDRLVPDALQSTELLLESLPACTGGTFDDLDFSLIEYASGWQLRCQYNAELYDAHRIEALLAHWQRVLHAVCEDSTLPLSKIPMQSSAERHALLLQADAGPTLYPSHMTVLQLIDLQTQRRAQATAVSCDGHSLTYAELSAAANRLANELRARGIGRGSRVGVCIERSTDLLIALLGVMKAGGAYVPLDPAYPAERLAQIIEDAGPMAVLTQQHLRARVPVADAALILVDAAASGFALRDTALLHRMPDANDVAYVIFTSGSTGRPKGVQIQHRALCNLLCAMRDQPGVGFDDRWLAVTTVSFDIATMELLLPLTVGALLIIARETDTADGLALSQLLTQERVTVMQATPVTWQLLLAAGWQPSAELKMLCGGEALPRPLADRLLANGGELWNLYGPTETTIWSSALRVRAGTGPVPLGPPIANTQFYVLDANGQLAPQGAPGELYIGGDGLALGYLNRPGLTRERFVGDRLGLEPRRRLYRTGDCVRRRADGTLDFLGRNDQQIKLRGFRIELGEIEAALRLSPHVVECVVVVDNGNPDVAALRAYLVMTTGMPASAAGFAASVRDQLRPLLPAYMIPSTIVALQRLPRMPNGKIDRQALPMPTTEPTAPARAATVEEPVCERQQQRLSMVWSAVLQAPVSDIHANFFEIGGHSLLAVRLIARIEAEFGRRLSLTAVFQHPTIAAQLLLLGEQDPRAYDFRQVLKLQANGSRAPLIAINNTGIYYALSKHLGRDQPFISLQLFDPTLPAASLPQSLEEIASGYVQLIGRVQSEGPYALLGWCVAGTLAFEIARQLVAAGHSVVQLSLFDTLAPGHLHGLPWHRVWLAEYAYRYQLIRADWRRVRGQPLAIRRFLAQRVVVKQLAQLWRGRAARRAPSALSAHGRVLSPEQYDQWLLNYLQAHADRYQPKPYAGSITLYRSASEPAGRFLDPAMGWGRHARDGVEVVAMDGDHFGVFQEPGVSRLAERIAADLDARMPSAH